MKLKKLILCCFFLNLGFLAFASGQKDASTQIISENLKFEFYKQSGSFCLYRRSELGKENWIPLYDNRALASTNSYSLSINDKIYPIKKQIGKEIVVESTENVIRASFPISKDLSVSQRFYFSSEKYETSGKVLCIETSFENTSGAAVNVALKALFDTSLGEKQRVPLYTENQSILRETHIDVNATNAKYLASANSIAACLFFLRLEKQTLPSEIFIANWDYLQSRKWVPNSVEGRSFSTKYYNNDSAVLFFWPAQRLNLNEKYTVTNCIGYYDYLKRDMPEAVVETHLQTLSEKERKSYDDILLLLQKIDDVKNHPENYSDEEIKALSDQVDSAMLKIQE